MKKFYLYLVLMLIFVGIVIAIPVSSSSLNWLTKKRADTLYCPIGQCGDGEGSGFYMYYNVSYSTKIYWNFSAGDKDKIYISFNPGEKYIFGDEVI